MSDTPQKTSPDARPSLRKQPQTTATRSSGSEVPKRLPTPRTIDYACIALGVTALALVARGLTLFGSTGKLNALMIKANNDATGSKKKVPYTASEIAKDVHTYRQGAILQGVIIGFALVLLLLAYRRTRTASGSRWAMLIVMLFTFLPLSIIPVQGLPIASNVAGVIVGLGAIAALGLVFIPKPSQQYFRDCREALVPPELRGQPRPSLFGGRRAGLAGPGGRAAAARAAAQTRSAEASTDRTPGSSKARAKVRSDADAIAHGAELARSRAKASKSRRTTD